MGVVGRSVSLRRSLHHSWPPLTAGGSKTRGKILSDRRFYQMYHDRRSLESKVSLGCQFASMILLESEWHPRVTFKMWEHNNSLAIVSSIAKIEIFTSKSTVSCRRKFLDLESKAQKDAHVRRHYTYQRNTWCPEASGKLTLEATRTTSTWACREEFGCVGENLASWRSFRYDVI